MGIKFEFIILCKLLLCSIIVLSCSKEVEYYSCNKDADRWVRNNLKEICEMTCEDWVKIGNIVYQKAIYNAFSPEQRSDLWLQKLEKIPALFLHDKEKVHVELLLSMLKSNQQWFSDDPTDEEKDRFEIFFYQWSEYASEELDWDITKIYTLVGTPENVIRTRTGKIIIEATVNNTIPQLKTRTETGEGYGNVCNCGDDSKYLLVCPAIDGYECKIDYNDPCKQTQRGCGFLWQDACWGNCKRSY